MLTRLWMTIPLCFVSGCVLATLGPDEPPLPVSGLALCEESRKDRDALWSDLLNTEDVEVLGSGTRLLAKLDAGCNG